MSRGKCGGSEQSDNGGGRWKQGNAAFWSRTCPDGRFVRHATPHDRHTTACALGKITSQLPLGACHHRPSWNAKVYTSSCQAIVPFRLAKPLPNTASRVLTLQPTLQLCPVHIPSCKDENGENFRAILPAAAPEPRNTTCLSAHPALRVNNLGDLCKVGRGPKTHSNHEHLINPEDNVKGER